MSAIYQSFGAVGCRFAFVQRLGPHLFSSFVVEIPITTLLLLFTCILSSVNFGVPFCLVVQRFSGRSLMLLFVLFCTLTSWSSPSFTIKKRTPNNTTTRYTYLVVISRNLTSKLMIQQKPYNLISPPALYYDMPSKRIDRYLSPLHLKSVLNLIPQKLEIALNFPYAGLELVSPRLVFLIDWKIVVLCPVDEVG